MFILILPMKNNLSENLKLQKFYHVIDAVSDQITITDTKGRIIFANKSLQNITGYSLKEIIGKTPNLWALTFNKEADNNTSFTEILENISKSNSCFFGEAENIKKDGKKYSTEVKITPVSLNNNIDYFIITERDISAINELDFAKNEFISLSSHELRTPLASISLASELLLLNARDLSDNEKFCLEEIYINSQKMSHLISTFMDLTRIELGTLSVNPEPIDIIQLLSKLILEVELQLQNKNLRIKRTIDSQIPIIEYDKKIFTVVFNNLLSNAIKYTPKNGNIFLSVKKLDNGNIEIKIKDTGIGIDKKDLKNIFKKQFRTENAIKSNMEGSGLGLYIVKSLIDKTKAKISVTSQINKGSIFRVVFPT